MTIEQLQKEHPRIFALLMKERLRLSYLNTVPGSIRGAFDFSKAVDGHDFWYAISKGNTGEFYDKYPEVCKTCNGVGSIMIAKLYPNGHTEVNETCPNCNGSGEEKSINLKSQGFIVGKWYKFKAFFNNSLQIARISEISNDSLIADAWIINCNSYNKTASFSLDSISDIIELKVEDEQIQKYLPEDHPDKIKPLVFGKYNIGDVVVSLADNQYRKVGQMFKVLAGDSNRLYYVNPNEYCSDTPDTWRIATSREFEAFNVGHTNISTITEFADKLVEEDYSSFSLEELVKMSVTEKLKEEILKQLKIKYPVGTKFSPSHLTYTKASTCTCIIIDTDIFHFTQDEDRKIIIQISLSTGNYTKNGHTYSEIIYNSKNGWCKIIGQSSEYPVNPDEAFKVKNKSTIEEFKWVDYPPIIDPSVLEKQKEASNIFSVDKLEARKEGLLLEQFKVGDIVVFLPEVAKRLNLFTPTWNDSYILKINEIIDSDNLVFNNQMNKKSVSNSPRCFRKATRAEVQMFHKGITVLGTGGDIYLNQSHYLFPPKETKKIGQGFIPLNEAKKRNL